MRDFTRSRVVRIRVDGRVLADESEQQRAILETVASLQGERLRKLVEVGLLAPRASNPD